MAYATSHVPDAIGHAPSAIGQTGCRPQAAGPDTLRRKLPTAGGPVTVTGRFAFAYIIMACVEMAYIATASRNPSWGCLGPMQL